MPTASELLKCGLGGALAGLLACVPDTVLKSDATTGGGSGGAGGAPGPVVCVEPKVEEWSYDVGLREGLGILIADLDGDGFGDTATAFQLSERVAIVWGGKSPQALVTDQLAVYRPNGWIRAGDFDGNGRPDLVTTSQDYGKIDVYLQVSPRVFKRVPITQKNDGQVLVVDAQGDGALDLLVRRADEYVLRSGDGKGGFSEAQAYPLSRADAYDSGDFDGDGKHELWRFRTAKRTFDIVTLGPGGIVDERPIADEEGVVTDFEGSFQVQDFDGDGTSELVLFEPKPSGAFTLRTHDHGAAPRFDRCLRVATPTSLVEPGRTNGAVAVGDVNADGKADVLFNSGCAGCVYWYSMMVQAP